MIGITASAQYKAPKIVAHRGFHATEGAARNSLNALKAAQDAAFWGSECDLQLTKDGEVLVVHGPYHPGKKGDGPRVNVQTNTKAKVQKILLSSGEKVPTLDEFLEVAAECPDTQLVIEVKDHATPQIETEVVRKVIAAVKHHKLQDMVTYIAFRQHVCDEFVRLAPSDTPVMYLSGNLTPEYVKGLGYAGISYSVDALRRLPRWIEEAHKLGLEVSIWTVNCSDDASWAVKQGVDYITTDKPSMVERVLE